MRVRIVWIVMPGLDPGIHLGSTSCLRMMDCRVKPGNDNFLTGADKGALYERGATSSRATIPSSSGRGAG
jgi:hypothetical protein